MSPSFKLVLAELFRFQDGRIMLAGSLEGDASEVVSNRRCVLLVDDVPTSTITIEGPVIIDGQSNISAQVVSTRDQVAVDSGLIREGRCTLIPAD